MSGLGCEQDGKNSERRSPTGERAVTGAWLVRKTGGKTVAPAAVRVRPFVRVTPVGSLSMLVDMHLNILWGKFVKMTCINENLTKY